MNDLSLYLYIDTTKNNDLSILPLSEIRAIRHQRITK